MIASFAVGYFFVCYKSSEEMVSRLHQQVSCVSMAHMLDVEQCRASSVTIGFDFRNAVQTVHDCEKPT